MTTLLSKGSDSGTGSGSHLPPPVLIAATVSAGLSTLLSLATVWLQLKHYHRPRLQRFVVRILVMVPIYSVASLVSLYSLDLAFFVDAVRDIYEAFVIYCFFSLLVEYLGGERSLIVLLHGREPIKHPWPVSLFKGPLDASDPFTFLGLKRGILQYVQIKPLLAFITVVLKATGTYKDGSLQADSGYTYVSIVYNLSVSISLYALAMFWVATHGDLKPFRPMPKFLCVKGIIFFSFWQGFGVSILVAIGWLHSARYETEKLSLAVQDTLICFEMPLFAFLHLYAFSYTDYIDESHIYSGRLPVWYAVRDAFGYKDLVLDSLTTVRGTGFSYRTFEPASSTVHSFGPGLDRRLRAGLRYSTVEGGKKYWVPQPGHHHDGGPGGGGGGGGAGIVTGGGGDAYGRKGREAWKSRPMHEARVRLEQRLVDGRMGYAPISQEEERNTVHLDPKLRRGENGVEPDHHHHHHRHRRDGEEDGAARDDDRPGDADGSGSTGKGIAGWWEGAREYDDIESCDSESDAASLEFECVEDDADMDEVYDQARTLEFGDWSYPVVDASREHARRRIRDEEDAFLSGKVTRPGHFRGGKGRRRAADPAKRPLNQHRPGSYGALAESGGNQLGSSSRPHPPAHQASSRNAPSTSSDRPAPIGSAVVSEVSNLVQSAIPGTSAVSEDRSSKQGRILQKLHLPFHGLRHGKDDEALPEDAVDLVVEDVEAEEEEQIRQRRRGEPSAKRTRVYRKAYVRPDAAPSSSSESKRLNGFAGPGSQENDAVQDPVEGETATVRDVVERNEDKDGKARSRSSSGANGAAGREIDPDMVVRVAVKEDETVAREVDGPESNPWT